MMRATSSMEDVTLVDLYAEYPDLVIDIDREQQRLVDHDVIIFQHPLYWYSTPAILKEWQDLVLEFGFAYGTDGTALHGKLFLNALTAGGKKEAYCAEGYNHFTIRELLHPIEQTAALCGMIYLPPFALFDARSAVDRGELDQHLASWVELLECLRDDRLNIPGAQRLVILNDYLQVAEEV